MIDATVILTTFNRSGLLRTALESLQRQRVPAGFEWEVLVVDNNSRDDTRQVIESFAALQPGRIHYLFEGRQGKTFALNTAIARAKGAVLAFTDDDVTLDPGWLTALVNRLREYRCGGAGGRIVPTWTQPKPEWLETDGPFRLGSVVVSMNLGPKPCWFIDTLPLGANMAITTDALRRVGLFRTDLGPTTGSLIRGEDSDICRRLLAAGERLLYVPDAVVYHPVDDRRVNRRYFERYYFDQGRAVTREEGIPGQARLVARVPRYLIRSACVKFVRWMTSVDVKRRFYHKLQFYYGLGRIAEARALRSGRPPADVPSNAPLSSRA